MQVRQLMQLNTKLQSHKATQTTEQHSCYNKNSYVSLFNVFSHKAWFFASIVVFFFQCNCNHVPCVFLCICLCCVCLCHCHDFTFFSASTCQPPVANLSPLCWESRPWQEYISTLLAEIYFKPIFQMDIFFKYFGRLLITSI